MRALHRFASLLGLPVHQAEDALYSDRAAKAVLSRRNFFAASGALAAGTVFVPSAKLYVDPWAEAHEFAAYSHIALSAMAMGAMYFARGSTKP
jgi:hypothetical protein